MHEIVYAFFDLWIFIVNNKFASTVYSKLTDSHLYLQSSSHYNPKSIDGTQKGVALRIRQICSSEQQCSEKSKKYMAYQVPRSHSPKKVKQTFENAGKWQELSLELKSKEQLTKRQLFFQQIIIQEDLTWMLL